MQNLKLKIRNLFRSRKINVFLLFFVLAFLILVLTKLSKVYTGTLSFKVKPKHVNATHVIVNTDKPALNITFETNGFNWLKYAITRPELDIDFEKDVSKKDSMLIWSVSKGYSNINNQFSIDKKIISINPDTLLFRFDVNDVKLVPVVLNIDIDYAQGFNTLDNIKTTPDSVKLIGPSTVLKKIKKIETQKLKLSNVKANIDQLVMLNLDSINDIKTNMKQVSLSINVSKFSEGIVELPIEIINIPAGKTINYFPKHVSLSYTTSLENYNNITSQDFKVICNYEDASEVSYLTPSVVKQPKDVKNIRLLQQKIEFIITE
ncbi:CdaR family protein [Olleya sp. R77988]|uniref:CdaR family protein n=1 Tax=Olleya sp. R77988 TaxID=3093875 RepID=UPI0037C6A59A